MSNATKATPENLFGNYTASKNVSISPSIKNASKDVADTVGTQLAGSGEIAGMVMLALFGFTLWKTEVSMDVSAAVLFPTTFFLASNGLLPYAGGVIDSLILAAAATFGFGIIKYATR